MNRQVISWIATATCLTCLGSAHGETVQLSIELGFDGQDKTFEVGALLVPDEGAAELAPDLFGLAGFILDVTASDELIITSSRLAAPESFSWFPHDGDQGIGIRGSQETIYAGPNDPAQDARVVQGLGLDTPVWLASGTYSGDWGRLQADVGDGMFTLLRGTPDPADPSIISWQGPGNTFPADVVIPAEVPEPSMILLLALGGLTLGGGALTCRRRRKA